MQKASGSFLFEIDKRNEKIKETSPEVWEWMKQIVEEHIALGHVIDE